VGNAASLLDFIKFDSAIALLNVDISVESTANMHVSSDTRSLHFGDELPLRRWCLLSDMVCKNRDDFSSNMGRLKIFTATASSQLSFSNISVSVVHLDFCNSAAEVPSATNGCHYDSNDDYDDNVSLCIVILLLNVIVACES